MEQRTGGLIYLLDGRKRRRRVAVPVGAWCEGLNPIQATPNPNGLTMDRR